jgi:hypothetical protein
MGLSYPRLLGHSETTLRLWLTRAGSHAEKVQAHFFHRLHLGHLPLDELFTTLRHKTQDLWVWVAFDPVTEIRPDLQVGPRTQDLAHALIHAVTLVLALGCTHSSQVTASTCTFAPSPPSLRLC